MFIISKIIQPFIIPPGCFILLGVLILLLYILRKKPSVIILSACWIFLLYFFSTEPAGNLLLSPLENDYPPLDTERMENADYIVVLGGGTVQGSPEEGGRASLSPDSLKRIVYGLRLHNIGGIPLILSGGSVLQTGGEPEAAAAKRLLRELGFPSLNPDGIITETHSRNTWENAVYTRKLIPGKHPTILLVTSAYHMPRSVACFDAQGFLCIPAPTDYKIDRLGYTLQSFLPSADSLRNSSAALREYIGTLYYRLFFGIRPRVRS